MKNYCSFSTSYENLAEDIFTAYYDARKNKRNTINALSFEINYETNLIKLAKEIFERKYVISPSICFINFIPVQREIFAADFRDRVIHHLLFNYLNPLLDRKFINDSYSCRKNRGTHYGIGRIRRFISQCSNNYTQDCYIMKLDIEGYFMKMDREILYRKLIAQIEQNETANLDFALIDYLLSKIIFNDPTLNCKIRGRKSDWRGLPATKSLFAADEGKGLPIGNLTSQLFGNIYLNDFDHYIKNELKIKYYGRYVDDMILMHEDKKYLLECRERINNYFLQRLELNLHPRKFYLQHYVKGVQFLGVFIKPFRIYAGRRLKNNFYKKTFLWKKFIDPLNQNLSDEYINRIVSIFNSYLGMLKHYNTYKLRAKILSRFLSELKINFIAANERCSKIKKIIVHFPFNKPNISISSFIMLYAIY